MREKYLASLRDPATGSAFRLISHSSSLDDGHIIEGELRAEGGNRGYRVTQGVPSFVVDDISGGGAVDSQTKTNITFSDKWRRFKSYGMRPEEHKFLFEWYRKKFGLKSHRELIDFYGRFRSILEVGPGSGFNTKFMAEHSMADVFALDISEAAFSTFENTRQFDNCCVIQADLMRAPFADDYFDFIIADGVLHHTPDTRNAVEALYQKLKPGGIFFFYVYRKMGAVRQFTDQYIRGQFTKLTPDDCYAACQPITELGRALASLDVKVTLEKPIDILGIPAGTHDVQRLFYYNFMKCFWNEAFDYDTNNMVNFDWYHPHDAWQHSEAEVIAWLEALGVAKFSINDANPNGISVLLEKPMRD